MCKASECKELHAESLHHMMVGMTSALNAVGFNETMKKRVTSTQREKSLHTKMMKVGRPGQLVVRTGG
jgi:hypothetical protein